MRCIAAYSAGLRASPQTASNASTHTSRRQARVGGSRYAGRRMTRLLRVGLAAILAIGAATGCSGIRVSHDYDPGADFSAYRSWYWLPRPGPSGDPRLDSDLLDARVRSAVEEVLAAKGYRKAPTGEGDFGVGWHGAIEGKLDVQTIDRYYGYGPRWGYGYGGVVTDTYVRQYDQGTLILDVVDARQRKLVWRGSAQAEVQERADPEARQRRIREAVEKVFARFPPQ